MNEKKFDPRKLQKLNDPKRLKDIPPDFIRRKLHVEKPDVMVEIGAGTAFFCVAFLEQYNPSKIYACDVSETMLQWMEENVVPKHRNIIPLKTLEHSVPLDDGIADLVFMINLHHELEYPDLTVKEAFRLLKRGGDIFIIDWKKEDMSEGPPVKIRCLPEEVGKQLGEAGFANVTIFEELPKHFLVVALKESVNTKP